MTSYSDIEGISNHIEDHIGHVDTVLHERVSGDLHIDVHHVKSTWYRRYEILVTSGMSAVPMAVPKEANEPRYAELVAILPKGWPINRDAIHDECNYWPIRLLKSLAHLPHIDGTWFGFGHTVTNAEFLKDLKPYAPNTSLCAAILLPPMTLSKNARIMKRADGKDIFFWGVIPLHLNELKFKLEHGVDALLELLVTHGVTDKIDPQRPSIL